MSKKSKKAAENDAGTEGDMGAAVARNEYPYGSSDLSLKTRAKQLRNGAAIIATINSGEAVALQTATASGTFEGDGQPCPQFAPGIDLESNSYHGFWSWRKDAFAAYCDHMMSPAARTRSAKVVGVESEEARAEAIKRAQAAIAKLTAKLALLPNAPIVKKTPVATA